MDAASVIEPVMTLPGRIGWAISYSELIFADPPYLVMQSQPDFPGCYDKPMDRGIVWDVFALIESVKRPGAHGVLTSDCGYAPDSGFQERVLVGAPSACSDSIPIGGTSGRSPLAATPGIPRG